MHIKHTNRVMQYPTQPSHYGSKLENLNCAQAAFLPGKQDPPPPTVNVLVYNKTSVI